MQELLDAIRRLNKALEEAEKRQLAKDAIEIGVAIGLGTIPGWPPFPPLSEWGDSPLSFYFSLVDVADVLQIEAWGIASESALEDL